MNAQKAKTNDGVAQAKTFKEFLEKIGPNSRTRISDLRIIVENGLNRWRALNAPEISLHCNEPKCEGVRTFRPTAKQPQALVQHSEQLLFLAYLCSNCRATDKQFALLVAADEDPNLSGQAMKLGELPAYGPPTPARLNRLIQQDVALFQKGRQCEIHGHGIGAFTYYRRVVEDQKNRILGEIKKVSERIGAPSEKIEVLDKAIAEIQFSKAMQLVKDAIPESLLIGGRNPLTLLHSALSIGVHEHTDEECLATASDIRLVLIDLSERIGQALKEQSDLQDAVNRLAAKTSK